MYINKRFPPFSGYIQQLVLGYVLLLLNLLLNEHFVFTIYW